MGGTEALGPAGGAEMTPVAPAPSGLHTEANPAWPRKAVTATHPPPRALWEETHPPHPLLQFVLNDIILPGTILVSLALLQ